MENTMTYENEESEVLEKFRGRRGIHRDRT
jgi:hypothetical protein